MRLFEITQDDNNTVFFVFINANPPTFGYTRALNYLREVSKDSDSIAFLNPVQDNLHSPLHFDENIAFVNKIFRKTNFDRSGKIENPIQALKLLSEKYSKIYFLTRDENVDDFERMRAYAREWGVEEFDILGLGDSERPLPTGTSKEASLRAVLENDFEAFKKTIPSNDKNLLSELFIALRKRMIDGEREGKNKVKEDIEASFHILCNVTENSSMLNESCTINSHGSKEIIVEDIIERMKRLKIVFNPFNKHKVSFAEDTKNNMYALIVKCKPENIRKFFDLNEKEIKKVLGMYITETTTSANIASSTTLFPTIKKRDIDYAEVKNLDYDNSKPKFVQAVNHIIEKYGYFDGKIAEKLKDMLG